MVGVSEAYACLCVTPGSNAGRSWLELAYRILGWREPVS